MKKLYTAIAFFLFVFALQIGAQTTHVVDMVDNEFIPEDITINEGDTILWVNEGQVVHTATSGSNCSSDGAWDSGNVSPGASYSHVFTEAGFNPYYCIPHCNVGMDGTITIEEATATDDAILTASEVEISPNPAQTHTRINIASDDIEDLSIYCYDLTGKQIQIPFKKTREASPNIAFDLQLSELNKGIYFIQLTTKGEVLTTRRLLVQ